MPKIYCRCSECHNKKDWLPWFKIEMLKHDDTYRTYCKNCNILTKSYKCQHDYWWELLYITIRDIVRKLRGIK